MSHKRSGICIEFHIHNFGSKIVSIRGSRLTLVFMQKIIGYVAERLSYRHLSSRKRFDLDKVLQNQIPVYETDVELINDDLASIIFVCAVYSNPLSFVEISSNQEQI